MRTRALIPTIAEEAEPALLPDLARLSAYRCRRHRGAGSGIVAGLAVFAFTQAFGNPAMMPVDVFGGLQFAGLVGPGGEVGQVHRDPIAEIVAGMTVSPSGVLTGIMRIVALPPASMVDSLKRTANE